MQFFSSIKQRILHYLDYKEISKYKFYQDTGITRGVLDKDGGMSEENTAKFIAYYPEINPEWLLTGNGNMLRDTEVPKEPQKAQEEAKEPQKTSDIAVYNKLVDTTEKAHKFEIEALKAKMENEKLRAELEKERKEKAEIKAENIELKKENIILQNEEELIKSRILAPIIPT